MRRMVAVLTAVVMLSISSAALAQTPQSNDAMTALLNEVHALRIAMQQQATIAPRIQLAMARLNIEEQRMEQLNQQLNQVRRELADVMLHFQQESATVGDLEKQIVETKDEKVRNELAALLKEKKRSVENWSALQQQLQTREGDVARELGTEQARWMQLNSQIDELERTLAPVRKQRQ